MEKVGVLLILIGICIVVYVLIKGEGAAQQPVAAPPDEFTPPYGEILGGKLWGK